MKKSTKLRIRGERGARIYKRIMFYHAMMTLYAVLFGIEIRLISVILWPALAAGLVAAFFISRQSRAAQREQQISSEVIELFPELDEAGLKEAYGKRRRKEIRLEALLYLLLGAETVLWGLILYAAGATEFSYSFCLTLLSPVVLLLSLGLFITSFMPLRKSDTPTLDEYAADGELRRIMIERSLRPDQRRDGSIYLLWTDAEPNDEDLKRLIDQSPGGKKRSFGEILIFIFAGFFFIGLPVILLLGFLLIYLATGTYSWAVIMSAVIILFVLLICIYLIAKKRDERYADRYGLLRKGLYRKTTDRVLSVIRNEDNAFTSEMCFDRSGVVKLSGAEQRHSLLLNTVGQEALLLTTGGGKVLAAVFRTDVLFGISAESEPEPAAAAAADVPNVPDDPYKYPEYPWADDPSEKPGERIENAERDAAPDNTPSSFLPAVWDLEYLRDAAFNKNVFQIMAEMDQKKLSLMRAEVKDVVATNNRFAKRCMDKLTRAEETERMHTISRMVSMKQPMSYELSSTENDLMARYGVDRAGLMEITKNPYRKKAVILTSIAAAVTVGGNIATVILRKTTGVSTGAIHFFVSTAGFFIFLAAIFALSNSSRVKKLHKAYGTKEFWEKIVTADIYQVLIDQEKGKTEQTK